MITDRRLVLGTTLMLLGLPVVVAVGEAVSFYVSYASNGSMVSSGETRQYSVYVPPTYDRAKPAPLVISLHGAGIYGEAQRETSRWNEVADREGFIVVYPSGFTGSGPRVWRVEPGPELMRDVTFITDLIDTLRARYDIDPARIYANGLSNGGGMSFVLSCTLSDRIAAVGMVGAAQTLPWKWCPDTRPVPMIAFHGTDDPQIPYGGGRTWVAPMAFPNVLTWTANWAQRNRCAPSPIDSAVAVDVMRRTYASCAGDAAVVLYTIKGGGHTWPGGKPLPEWVVGRTSQSVDASSLMWAFFREHPRR